MKKKTAILIVLALTILQFGPYAAKAADEPPQSAPERLRIEAIYTTPPNAEPPIGYNEFDKYYADFICDKLDAPSGVSSPSLFLNYYLQEVNKGYRPTRPVILKEGNVPASASADNVRRLKGLSSGTIYYAHAKAYYKYTKETAIYTSSESTASNMVKFLTDIEIDAYSVGPNQIKIEWDDVWNSGKRMDYKLYISESSSFTNSPYIHIGSEQISRTGPVIPNEATGKLEYTHTVRDPGRVYYIKVVPDTAESELKRSPESPTVTVSSFILAKTTKMSVSDAGTVWKIEWSPVVTGLGDSVKVSYQIFRGTGTGGGIEQYMAAVDDTSFFLTLQPGEESYYYVIRAQITRNGQDVYPGIRIQSEKIYVRESEVPSTPEVPELVSEFSDAGAVIISYDAELKTDSATVLWRAPLKGSGEADKEVKYDIWLISDPNDLDSPPSETLIASSLKMGSDNNVLAGTKLLGYKFRIDGLTSNSVYYFKIIAKKDFVDIVDSVLNYITLESDPALKVIITPPAGPIDQPLVPGRPPFELKKDSQGRDMVTSSSAVVKLQDKWYEEYIIIEGGRSAWVYRTPEQLETTSPGAISAIENGTANPLKYRKVEYDEGVTIDVGCVEFTPDIDYESVGMLPADKVVGFPVTPNDPDEDVTAAGAIPDGKKHNIDINIQDLQPNTTYVFWLRAARVGAGLISGPSNAIIVTTLPDLPDIIEKPTVPVFNYYHAADTHIDLGWDFNAGYNYYLEFGTKDNRSSASGKAVVTPAELKYTSYYRVKDLVPDTLYYFWIQAEAVSASGERKLSEFSDSLLVKTEKDMPPDSPKGFGVKGGPGAIGKNSISYEWMKEDNMEYMLEIAGDISYKNSTKISVKNVSELTVDELRSNFRYFARLYAYDPAKQLYSEPTQSVTVRTLRSEDEYDSSEDPDDLISGEFVVKDKVSVNGIWTVRITGVNADRFIQHVQKDKVLDYLLDLRVMPAGTNKISLLVSQKVFRALGMLGENLIIKTRINSFVVRPGVLADKDGVYGSAAGEADFEFLMALDSSEGGSNTKNLNFKTAVAQLEVRLKDGMAIPLDKFERPLKVVFEYDSAAWYNPGISRGYVLAPGEKNWIKCESSGRFDTDSKRGEISFDTLVPGRMAVAEPGPDYYDDISKSYARKSIANVVSLHPLKAISGACFEPDKYLTLGDGARIMLDMLDAPYSSSNYMTLAVKAGIIRNIDSQSPQSNCTREKLLSMVMRVCELKTSEKVLASAEGLRIYKDAGQIDTSLLPKIAYAHESGVITSRFSDTFGPGDPVTRAETMVLLEKLLRYAGEL